MISLEPLLRISTKSDCGKECGGSPRDGLQAAFRGGLRRIPHNASKPVRCGNPTLGRFDSGAAVEKTENRDEAQPGEARVVGRHARGCIRLPGRPVRMSEYDAQRLDEPPEHPETASVKPKPSINQGSGAFEIRSSHTPSSAPASTIDLMATEQPDPPPGWAIASGTTSLG